MDKRKKKLEVRCTCCDALMTVDSESGEVLFTEKPKKKGGVSFEDALQKVHQDQETAEDRFREAFQKEEGRLKVVDQKFEELMKRKDELEQPVRPIDLD